MGDIHRNNMKSLLVALLVAAAASSSCNNPLFSADQFDGQDVLSLLPVPAPMTKNTLCPAYVGKDSCCDMSILNQMSSMFETMDGQVHSQLVQARLTVSQVSSMLIDQPGGDQIVNLLNKALDSSSTCYNSISNYVKGMLCFACDAEAGSFVNETATDIYVKVQRSSCSSIISGCFPLIDIFLETIAIAGPLPADAAAVVAMIKTYLGNCSSEETCMPLCENLGGISQFAQFLVPHQAQQLQAFLSLSAKQDNAPLRADTPTKKKVHNTYVEEGGFDAVAVGQESKMGESKDDGLSTGAIIGIAVGAAAGVALVAFAIVYSVRKRKTAQAENSHYLLQDDN